MSTGFPAENWYAPGDGGMGNPVRTPNDTSLYGNPQSAARFARGSGPAVNVLGLVAIAALVYGFEHMRLKKGR